MEPPTPYRSYLLRVCPRDVAGHLEWTVTLESVATGRRVTLPDLPSLVAYLSHPADEPGAAPAGRVTAPSAH